MQLLRRPERSTSPRPKKKSRTEAQASTLVDSEDVARKAETLPIAGGPDKYSLQKFKLWSEQNSLCDLHIHCRGKFLVKATKFELSAYSPVFLQLSRSLVSKDGKPAVLNLPDADPGTLERLLRSLYEKEVSLTPINAPSMLALSYKLEVEVLSEVIEQYLIAQLAKDNAVEALSLAEKYKCQALRDAAIPLAAISFDQISSSQLEQLPFKDVKELLASDNLIIQEEHSLFRSIKTWSAGKQASRDPQEADDQLLSLIGEIRLECIPSKQLNLMLEDEWLQQRPKVLTAMAKALARRTKLLPSGPLRKSRGGRVVQFRHWSKLVEEADEGENKAGYVRSPHFSLHAGEASPAQGYLQVYPCTKYKESYQPRENIGVFLAMPGEIDFPGCTLTLINQQKPTNSISREYFKGAPSQHGSVKFWGSKRFMSLESFSQGGFIVDDTVVIRITPLLESARCTPNSANKPESAAGSVPDSLAAP